ncbi:MAG: hypothetical protein WD491_12090 [Balneolales bacterium]
MSEVVEFLGLPGAGKTTIQVLLTSHLQQQEISILTNQDYYQWQQSKPFLSRASAPILNPYKTIYMLGLALKSFDRKYFTQPDFLLRLKKFSVNSIQINRYILNIEADYLILSEAGIHNLWLACLLKNKPLKPNINDLLGCLAYQIPVKYVFLEVDIENAAKRIQNRISGKSRFDKMDFETIVNMFKSDADYYIQIARALKEKKSPVLFVDGNLEPQQIVGLVSDWIQH